MISIPVTSIFGAWLSPPSPNLWHLVETLLPEAVENTLILVAMVAVGTGLIGVGTAWIVTQCSFPGVRLFEWALLLPFAMPAYIIGYAYTAMLAFPGPVQSWIRATFGVTRDQYWFPEVATVWGAGAMFTLVFYPYVYLLSRAAFLEQSGSTIEVARTLGRSPWGAFLTISLPLARPAIAAGIALALMETIADFGTVHFFGQHTLTTAIYRTWMGMGDRLGSLQLSAGLLSFALLLLFLERWSRGRAAHVSGRKRASMASTFTLGGPSAALATIACSLPVLLGFIVPVGYLIGLQFQIPDDIFDPLFQRAALHSFILSAMAAALVLAVALVLAYAGRLSAARSTRVLARIATLGYGVPGTVVAVGVLFPLGAFDNAVDAFMRANFGISTGLILSGTLIALMFAYLVRFLAIGYGAVESGFAKIPRSIDDVARTLGSGPGEVARRVHAPLLRRSMLAGAILAFGDVLKELPMTLVVRPFNFDTLAIRVFNFASDERFAQAATGSLVIVLIGLAPVVILTRMIATERRGERTRRIGRDDEAVVPAA